MKRRRFVRRTVLWVVAALTLALPVSAALATTLSVGSADFARGTVPLAIAASPGITAVTCVLERADGSVETSLATQFEPGRYAYDVSLRTDTTLTARAYSGAVVVWSDKVVLQRATYTPATPVLIARHDQVLDSDRPIQATIDALATTVTVQQLRDGSWKDAGSLAASPDTSGVVSLAGVELSGSHPTMRVLAVNGFGSAASGSQSVYSIGDVPDYKKLVLVDKSARRIWVIRSGVVTYTCRCAIGMPWTPTPTGTFRLGNRHRTPNAAWGPWRLRLWRQVHHGDAHRYVSTRFFIHGTNRPSSIGHYASHGCVRLTNANIRKLSTRMNGDMAVIRE